MAGDDSSNNKHPLVGASTPLATGTWPEEDASQQWIEVTEAATLVEDSNGHAAPIITTNPINTTSSSSAPAPAAAQEQNDKAAANGSDTTVPTPPLVEEALKRNAKPQSHYDQWVYEQEHGIQKKDSAEEPPQAPPRNLYTAAMAHKQAQTKALYRCPPNCIPETEAWFLSRLFFSWARPLFRRASYLQKENAALEHEDLLPLPLLDYGRVVGKALEDAWDVQQQKEVAALRASGITTPPQRQLKLSELKGAQGRSTTKVRRAVAAVIGWQFWWAGCIKIVNTGLQFSFPLLLNAILSFIEDSQAGRIPENAPWYDTYRGYWLSAILFVAMAAKAVTENMYFHKVYRAGYQARVAVSVAVYNKSLRLANAERQDTTLGELINLMQVDATKIEMFVPQVHVLWDGLLQIAGYMAILYTLIGWPCFAGMLLMVAAGPIQGVIMKKMFGRNHQMAKFTDQRVKTTNEALQGIQVCFFTVFYCVCSVSNTCFGT